MRVDEAGAGGLELNVLGGEFALLGRGGCNILGAQLQQGSRVVSVRRRNLTSRRKDDCNRERGIGSNHRYHFLANQSERGTGLA